MAQVAIWQLHNAVAVAIAASHLSIIGLYVSISTKGVPIKGW